MMHGGKHVMHVTQQRIYNLLCYGLVAYLMQKIVGARGMRTKLQNKIIPVNHLIKLLMDHGIMVSGQVMMGGTWEIFGLAATPQNIFSNILKFRSSIIF